MLIRRLLTGLFAAIPVLLYSKRDPLRVRTRASRRGARRRQDAHHHHAGARHFGAVPAYPADPRHAARRHRRHAHLRRRHGADSGSRKGRSSPIFCWPTRSTAPRRRPRAVCSKRCRSGRSRSRTRPSASTIRSGCWRRRTRSNRRVSTLCPRRSSIASR